MLNDLLCAKHKIHLECMGGCSAHRDNWYCTECDKEDDSFKRNTEYKKTEFGHEINCKNGLWGITAPTKKEAECEARHYFQYYFSVGEYNT